jgi:Tetrapyrrole (Corrin/Porphyrin) Methylases
MAGDSPSTSINYFNSEYRIFGIRRGCGSASLSEWVLCPVHLSGQRLNCRWSKAAADSDPSEGAAMKGKIYLVGIGPGDADLLTLQAVRLLRSAEVVLHDDQISSEILDLIPPSAQVRSVSKLSALPGNAQEKIHSLLLSAAREGHQVVRLKTAGSVGAARVDDEMEALAQAGVEFELISGAASALGAAAGTTSR